MISKQGIEQTRPELSTHDTALAALQTDLGDPSARTNLQTILALLGNPDAVGKSLYGNLGDFVGQTNLQTLLAALGIPDVSGKSLYVTLVTDRLDHATYGLSATETKVSAIPTTMRGTDSAATVADGWDSALATILDNFNATRIGDLDELAAANLPADIAAIPTTVLVATGVGVSQIAATTIDLNQAAATYDLLTGTSQAVILESLNIKMPTGAAGGSLTSISIQTDDVTAGVIINSTDGAVANLTSEADLSWTGSLYITVATKIRLTIAGGAHGTAYVCQVTAKCRAVVAGGNLA